MSPVSRRHCLRVTAAAATLKRAMRVQVEKLRAAFDRAGELGVKIAIENHSNGAGERLRAAVRAGFLVLAGLACPALSLAQPMVAAFERFHAAATSEAAVVEGGLFLLNELNCVACHAAPEAWRERIPGRAKLSLLDVGDRLAPQKLAEFIRDPHRLKPGTLMPHVAAPGEAESAALVAYLAALKRPTPARAYPLGNAERGRHLYETVGCVACHAASEAPTSYPSVPLVLGRHYDRNALADFIQNPLRVRPAGRMPATELTDAEAADLATFLGAKPLAASPPATGSLLSAGRAAFAAQNCAACHDVGEKQEVKFARPLIQVKPEQGCLNSPTAGGLAPRFNLSPVQRRALVAAVRQVQTQATPPTRSVAQVVHGRMEQLNCVACHEWRGKGGADPARSKYFVAQEGAAESLGELGRLPPSLDWAGRKLTSEWLEKLLWGSGGGVRPYMSVRMPRFGKDASADLVPLLEAAGRPATPQEIDTSGGQGHQRFATGRTLMGTGTGGVGCVTCHGLKDREPTAIRAINLTFTAQRLRPEYFKALLLDPQTMQPGTIMPPIFAGRSSADKEIESIWTFFKELDQSAVLPEGLAVEGSFELKPEVEGRPIVFRTFLFGAGVQAVAVGNPSGAHAAFDSFEVRWALVWRGRFLDAQSNWEERPMKPIKALGEDLRMLPNHLPFVRREVATDPWPTLFGRQAGYVFEGYRLDADGVPTFRYRVGDLEVEDTLRPIQKGNAFQRTVVVKGSGAGWYFRGLTPNAEPQPLIWKNGTAIIEEQIKF